MPKHADHFSGPTGATFPLLKTKRLRAYLVDDGNQPRTRFHTTTLAICVRTPNPYLAFAHAIELSISLPSTSLISSHGAHR